MEDELAPPGRMKYYEGMDLIDHQSFGQALSPLSQLQLFIGQFSVLSTEILYQNERKTKLETPINLSEKKSAKSDQNFGQ